MNSSHLNPPARWLDSRALAFLALVIPWLACVVAAAPGPSLTPVSGSDRPVTTGSRDSMSPQFIAHDSQVIFVSLARNLVPQDNLTPFANLYLRDLATGSNTLVSINALGTGGGNGNSLAPSAATNGMIIAFESDASDLVANDTNRFGDVFVRDLTTGITTLVSVSTNAGASGNRWSGNPLISADGRYVAFESLSTDLALTFNSETDIFLRDLQTGTTRAVTGGFSGTGKYELAAMTPNGRFIVYVGYARLALGNATSLSEVYWYDAATSTTKWVSSGAIDPAITTTNRCFNPVLSADGQEVVFVRAHASRQARLFRWTAPSAALNPIVLGTEPGLNVSDANAPALSPDGRHLAVIANDPASYSPYDHDAFTRGHALVLVDLHDNVSRVISSGGPDCSPVESCRTPLFSGDGRSIGFIAAQSNQMGGFVYRLSNDCVEAVIVSTNGQARPAVPTSAIVLSFDGRRAAFESLADDLCPGDYNQSADVFLRNLNKGAVELISARAANQPSSTSHRPSSITPNSISADGRWVAFSSHDQELIDNDPNPGPDIFVRDLLTGSLVAVTAGVPPVTSGYHDVSTPVLSADGRFVVYREDSTNLVWKNLATGSSERITGTAPSRPAMTMDGRLVFFERPIQTGTGITLTRIFRRDMLLTNPSEQQISTLESSSNHSGPVLSPNEHWLAYTRTDGASTQLWLKSLQATNATAFRVNSNLLVNFTFTADSKFLYYSDDYFLNTYIYRFDLAAPPNQIHSPVCFECTSPSLSADGRWMAVQWQPQWYSGGIVANNLYLFDTITGLSNLVTVSHDGSSGANHFTEAPRLSFDGRYVAFVSRASNLVPDDTNGVPDVFVRDLWAGKTLLLSANPEGRAANGSSFRLVSSPDGRTVYFQSYATDLTPAGFNLHSDLFVARLAGADTDEDQLEDEWELAYFDTLDRDGSGDWDADGKSDRDEYHAATDPTNAGSVLRVLALSTIGSNTLRLVWSASPGRLYQLQSKDNVAGATWTDLGDPVMAVGTTGTAEDNPGTTSRFYRVVIR